MPRSSRQKSEETRARVVDAAYQLFLEQGYHATSMRDVARRAGLTVGAIYNHFATKEDLWKEIVLTKHPYHEIFPQLRAVQGQTYADLVRSAAGVLVEALRKRPDLLNLMLTEIVEFKGAHVPDIFMAIFPEALAMRPLLAGKEGNIRPLPMPTLLRSFIGLFFSYYITGVLMNHVAGVSIDAASLDDFIELYLYGVLDEADPTRGQPRHSTPTGPTGA
ncbi:MAG: TetR/AcrR family transcriptional regulator [Anaerolineaceae bacterium]|nr:TetR/AcrR family transcriptional regulator [Anaerolineaceae bacterium]